jgi:hypothetical protein
MDPFIAGGEHTPNPNLSSSSGAGPICLLSSSSGDETTSTARPPVGLLRQKKSGGFIARPFFFSRIDALPLGFRFLRRQKKILLQESLVSQLLKGLALPPCLLLQVDSLSDLPG